MLKKKVALTIEHGGGSSDTPESVSPMSATTMTTSLLPEHHNDRLVSTSPQTDHHNAKRPRNHGINSRRRFELPQGVKLIVGAGGIYASFLYVASLQEDVFSYVGPDGSTFEQAWFLQVVEALMCMIVGVLGILFCSSTNHNHHTYHGITLGLPLRMFWWSGAAQVSSKVCVNLALTAGLSYPVMVLAKSAKMVPVMVGSLVVGGATYQAREYAQVLAIMVGTILVLQASTSSATAATTTALPLPATETTTTSPTAFSDTAPTTAGAEEALRHRRMMDAVTILEDPEDEWQQLLLGENNNNNHHDSPFDATASVAMPGLSVFTSATTIAMLYIALSLMFDGAVAGFQKRLQTDTNKAGIQPTTWDFMFWMSVPMALISGVWSLAIGEFAAGVRICVDQAPLRGKILGFALCSAVGQVFICYTLANFDPLVVCTVTTTRKIFTVLLSIFCKGHHLSPTGWMGVALASAGILYEVEAKREKKKQQILEKQQQAASKIKVLRSTSPASTTLGFPK